MMTKVRVLSSTMADVLNQVLRRCGEVVVLNLVFVVGTWQRLRSGKISIRMGYTTFDD